MLCERCGKHEANVHITKNINGKVTEMNLCSECADRSGEKIAELRHQIELAVESEEYEKAAELRDQIKALENGQEAQ